MSADGFLCVRQAEQNPDGLFGTIVAVATGDLDGRWRRTASFRRPPGQDELGQLAAPLEGQPALYEWVVEHPS